MSIRYLDFRRPEGEAVAARVTASAQIELPAVPWADDILAHRVVLQGAGLAVGVHRFQHPVKDAALADRPAAMRTLIVPGNQFTADVEDADLSAVAGNHPALPLGDLP